MGEMHMLLFKQNSHSKKKKDKGSLSILCQIGNTSFEKGYV